MSKTVVSQIADRAAFFHLLSHNPGLIVLKLGATWCGPCKIIEKEVHAFFATSPVDVVCGDIDVDDSFDFYSFLKSKKMVDGIPVLLCYKKGNQTFIPDDSITGPTFQS
jgi:thiol-disulfide isomerase/thioredoxin